MAAKPKKKEAEDLMVDDYLFTNELNEQNDEITEQQPKVYVPLESIQYRQSDTRPLNEKHVEELADSIAVLGLLQPLVVDQKLRLLAGGHRLGALILLKEKTRDIFEQQIPDGKIPVRLMPFDAESEPEKALQVEVAENEHRRDYTPTEVRALAERLKKAGYTNSPHRPKKGEKALVPALKVIINKSRASIMRYLQEESDQKKSVSRETLSPESKALKRIQKDLESIKLRFSEEDVTEKQKALAKKIPAFLRVLKTTLAEMESNEQ